MIVSSDEAAVIACGLQAVRNYRRVKVFFTHFGHELEHQFADAVGGHVQRPPRPDVLTHLGEWEFCTQANTKNAAGAAHDLERVPAGHLVQVLGTPRLGWISAVEFLDIHGVPMPERRADECVTRAIGRAMDQGEQLVMV